MAELLLHDQTVDGRSLWCGRSVMVDGAVRITIEGGPFQPRATIELTQEQQERLLAFLGRQSASEAPGLSGGWVPIPVDLLRALAEALERPRDPEGAKLCAKRVVAAYRAAVEPPDLRAARETLAQAGYTVGFPALSPEGVP